jgi:hypothetical protein
LRLLAVKNELLNHLTLILLFVPLNWGFTSLCSFYQLKLFALILLHDNNVMHFLGGAR